jgi:hypothetical protein
MTRGENSGANGSRKSLRALCVHAPAVAISAADFSILNEIARLNGALTRELGGLISTHALRGKTLKDPRHPFQQ